MSGIGLAFIVPCPWRTQPDSRCDSWKIKRPLILWRFMAMCPTRPSFDQAFIERALTLARDVRGLVWPNPPVGCVIAHDGVILAEAATHPGGRPHAERKALALAGEGARGATLYVTLEPCCHWGKTPPCTDAIIKAGIARIVCAVQDPDPRVNGGGFATLRQAGIDVSVGIGAEAAQAIMSGFFHRVHTGMPELVTCDPEDAAIPNGVDAVLRTTQSGLTLATRADVQTCSHKGTDLMRWMGSIGLTIVAIPRTDPILQKRQLLGDTGFAGQAKVPPTPQLGTGI